jgi:hypothetical protein
VTSRRRSAVHITLLLTFFGFGFLAWSSFLFLGERSNWWANVWIEVGVTLLLFWLVWLSRHIEKQLDAVQTTQRRNETRITELADGLTQARRELRRTHEELSSTVAERIAAERQADMEVFDKLELEPTRKEVIQVLKHAEKLGIRVPEVDVPNVPGRQARVGFHLTGAPGIWELREFRATLALYFGPNACVSHSITWERSDRAEDFLYKVSQILIAEDLYPSDDELDIAGIFGNLSAALKIGYMQPQVNSVFQRLRRPGVESIE